MMPARVAVVADETFYLLLTTGLAEGKE